MEDQEYQTYVDSLVYGLINHLHTITRGETKLTIDVIEKLYAGFIKAKDKVKET